MPIMAPVTILDFIGRTPLVRLKAIPGKSSAEVWIKWEGANPTGSMKDRIALKMIEGAEARSELRPGETIVEFTGGSTGSSLALVCAVKGYRVHLVCSDAVAREKLDTMRAFGAELEVISSASGLITPALLAAMQARVEDLAQQPSTFWTKQFSNPDNRSAYHVMAEELLSALNSRIDAFVMGVGTGGCFSGNAEVLKERLPAVQCVAVEPATARVLSGGPVTGHHIEGFTAGVVGSITRTDLIDEIVAVTDEDAAATARRLAREEGIFSGISAGANVWAALRIAEQLGPGRRVATVAPDSGLKYLQGRLFA
jgi:cysteine synthase A